MKYSILILLFPILANAEWRPVHVSSITNQQSINENFRRASIDSNRKLDKFSKDTVYGPITFSSNTVFSGNIDIGLVVVTSACVNSVACVSSCATGYKLLSGGCAANDSGTVFYAFFPDIYKDWYCQTATVKDYSSYAICARIK